MNINSESKSPVLLILFNRPVLSKKVIEAVREYQPTKLYIAVDGPRINQPDDQELCRQSRDLAKGIEWECDVRTLFHSTNLGCKFGPITAIDWLFKHEEAGIILEDDIVPVPSFFFFMEQMLREYEGSEQIGMVSGCNPYATQSQTEYSYHFSYYTKTWGWATWANRWQRYYDVDCKDYISQLAEIKKHRPLTRRFHRWWWVNLSEVLENGYDAWDFQWELAHFAENLLVIRPRVNLIAYLGDGADATHTSEVDVAYKKAVDLEIPLLHPPAIQWDRKADVMLEHGFVGGGPIVNLLNIPGRVIRKLLTMINRPDQ